MASFTESRATVEASVDPPCHIKDSGELVTKGWLVQYPVLAVVARAGREKRKHCAVLRRSCKLKDEGIDVLCVVLRRECRLVVS